MLRFTDLGLKLFDKVRLKSCKISLDRSIDHSISIRNELEKGRLVISNKFTSFCCGFVGVEACALVDTQLFFYYDKK